MHYSFLLRFILIISLSLNANSQILKHYNDFELEWGEMFRASGNVESLFKTQDGKYFSLVNRTTFYNFFTDYKKRYYIEPVVGLEPESRKKINLTGDGKRTNLEGLRVLGNQIVAVSQKNYTWKNETGLYYHYLYPNRPYISSDGYPLGIYSYSRRKNGFDFLSITNNLNKTNVGIFYTMPSVGLDFPRYGFGILNESEELVVKDESIFPYNDKHISFFDDYLSPAGDYFVLAREYSEDEMQVLSGWNAPVYKQIRVFKVVDGELDDFEINQSEYLLSEITVTSNEKGHLIFSGLYSEEQRSGIRGLFYIEMLSDGSFITEEYHAFSLDFIMMGQPISVRDKAMQLEREGRYVQGLSNYEIRNLRQTDDGGFVGIAEHFDLEERFSGVGTPGTSNRVDTYFYYNDLIVYKLDSTGKLEWKIRIPKSQHSINDGGYFLSVVEALTDEYLYILFNDDIRNYDDRNLYLNPETPKSAHFSFNRNAIAITKVSLNDGSVNRYALEGKKELSTVLVPKVCIENTEINEIFLYSRSNKRHRYGRIVFLQ